MATNPAYFITGTDTGVGKTVLTALLTRYLRIRNRAVRAVKPFCSGGRDDAKVLYTAQDGEFSLDEINPWYFRAALTPLLAARLEGHVVPGNEVLRFLRNARSPGVTLLIEGAGGLMSPLGPDYCAVELIKELKAIPLIVCPNRLGAINQARLALAALPRATEHHAMIILMSPPRANAASRSNAAMLTELAGAHRIRQFPWLANAATPERVRLNPRAMTVLEELVAAEESYAR